MHYKTDWTETRCVVFNTFRIINIWNVLMMTIAACCHYGPHPFIRQIYSVPIYIVIAK